MNLNTLARQYDHLTPEERARLIFAAGARGDEAEQKRLLAAGKRITLSMQDHAPFAHAVNGLAMILFLRLLETAANYFDAFALLRDFEDTKQVETEDEPDDDDGGDSEAATSADASAADATGSEQSASYQCLQLMLAQGFT